AGATAVALSSASILNGYQLYEEVYNGLAALMERKGYSGLADFRGLTHRRIRERAERQRQILREIQVPRLEGGRCSGCGRCARSCVYGAIRMAGRAPEFLAANCHGCGLCVSVCPAGAIGQDYYGQPDR
ncbi:MAG: 4Fe-4S dicluster domain-containing protein, partial [Peptococcaceae bacterium]|nr:4Fe-4S dicluster domain-containing protein [Peptococcaceae bacterium]